MEQKITLREMREQNGLSRADVAKALGVSISAFSNYENGNRKISIEQVLVLAKIYEESTDAIIHAQLNSCQKAQ